jgi:hypothetical protein
VALQRPTVEELGCSLLGTAMVTTALIAKNVEQRSTDDVACYGWPKSQAAAPTNRNKCLCQWTFHTVHNS